MKVLLDGQGSDEFLGGYMHSFYRLIGNELHNLKFGNAWNILREHSKQQEFSTGKTADVFLKSLLSSLFNEQQLYDFEYKFFHPWISKSKDKTSPFHLTGKSKNKFDDFLYQLLFNTLLPSLLHFEDRNSMAFSIESRVPFLDHRLVQFGFTLRNDERINRGTTKYILRESMRGTLPDAILNRKDKKGFTTPGAKWLRGDMHFLLEQDFSKLEMLDQKKIKELIAQFEKGNDKPAHMLWRIGGLNYWVENFV
jgi:asparagine synthase (glutamine-hydrolysing)